ncbi:MAG TPA: hypothetical protein VJ746_18470 [Nitrospira sp.]|nr:hypothetical protein [Nitrospira sp.]
MIRMHTVLIMGLAATLFIVSQMAMPGPMFSAESTPNTDFELLRSDIRTKKMTLLAEQMEFSGKEADAFWPIYRKYEVELAAINDRKVALLKEYLQAHQTLDETKANEIANGVFEVDQKTLDLRRKYFQEVSQAVSAKTAARFLQLERWLQQLVDVQLASGFPLIKK